MAAALPTLDEYLARLPCGIDSYPEAQVKGSVLRSLRNHLAFDALIDTPGLPPGCASMLRERPTATCWLPEVHFNAVMGAFYDVVFSGRGGLAAYETWVADQNRKLFETPLYRVLFVVVSPERLLSHSSNRWTAFRRGSVLEVLPQGRGEVEMRLTYPPHLEPPSALHAFTGAFHAAIGAAGGDVLALEWRTVSASETRWNLRWR